MSYYDAKDVREAARGNWLYLIADLAPLAEQALRKPGKHVPCPIHGGKDGFRVIKKDFLETGGGVCNTCGPRHDGFELLMWLNNWVFKEALDAVGERLGVEKRLTAGERRAAFQKRDQKPVEPSRQSSVKAEPTQAAQPNKAESSVENVAPIQSSASKTWLSDVQERMEVYAKRQAQYSHHLHGKIDQVWAECVPLGSQGSEPMRDYLKNRGILCRWQAVEEAASLKFHSSMPYFDEDGNEVGRFPAIVGAIRNVNGDIDTLHRIYLTRTGKKARVPEPKKMMPVPDDRKVTGSAIRLGVPRNGVLALAEGVETALAAFKATGIPTWATVNAVLLERIEIPEGVHTVIIWADKDRSMTGQQVADSLRDRLVKAGISVYVLVPDMPIPKHSKSVDWNDILLTQGLLGFPSAAYFKRLLSQPEKAAQEG